MSYTRARHQGLHVHIVRMRRERIDEEEQDVDLAFRDHRADLLVAAQGAALQARDRKGGASLHHPAAGRSRGKKREGAQGLLMHGHETGHVVFLGVVRDERQCQLGHDRSCQLFQRSRHHFAGQAVAARDVLNARDEGGRREAGDLEKNLGLDRLDELVALTDRNRECAGRR